MQELFVRGRGEFLLWSHVAVAVSVLGWWHVTSNPCYGLNAMIWEITSFLAIIVLTFTLYKCYNTKPDAFLPLSTITHRRAGLQGTKTYYLGRHSDLTLTWTSLRLQTTTFNRAHDALMERLEDDSPQVRAVLRALYDLGVVVATAGMFGGVALMVWSLPLVIAPSDSSLVHTETSPSVEPFENRAAGMGAFGSASNAVLRPIVSPSLYEPVLR